MPRAKKEEDDGPIELFKMGGIKDDKLVYELVYDGTAYQYAIGHRDENGNVDVSQAWDIEDWDPVKAKEVIIRPWQSKLISEEIMPVPTKYEKYESKKQLYRDTLEYFKKYVDLPEVENKINMHYVALTWLYDRLGELPYRRFLGNYGTGKSRALQVMASICFRPQIISAVPTPAIIFRMIEEVRGTLAIDELHLDGKVRSESFVAIEQILNAGYERKGAVYRCVPTEGEKGFVIEPFRTFSPKILSTRTRFADRALESRCLTAHTYRSKDTSIPISLDEEFYEIAEHLRNQWLTFRLVNYWKPLVEAKAIKELHKIEQRIRQIIAPLTQVAYRDYDFFVDYANMKQEEAIMLRQESHEGRILTAMFDLVGIDEKNVEMEQLINLLHSQDETMNSRIVGGTVRRMGFRVQRKIVGERKIRVILNTGRFHKGFLRHLNEYYIVDEDTLSDGLNGQSGPTLLDLQQNGPLGPHGPPLKDAPPSKPKIIYNCPIGDCEYIAKDEKDLGEHLRDTHKFSEDNNE